MLSGAVELAMQREILFSMFCSGTKICQLSILGKIVHEIILHVYDINSKFVKVPLKSSGYYLRKQCSHSSGLDNFHTNK